MNRHPLRTRRRRVSAAVLLLILAPVAYLVSYPITFRALYGSDDLWRDRKQPSSAAEQTRYRIMNRLEKYYFPPVIWLIDHTPLQDPILQVAKFADVDEQIEFHIMMRQYLQNL